MAISDYRIAAGWGVALGSLNNIEDIAQFQYQGAGLYPTSQPINRFPVRTKVGSGQMYGDGAINHEWWWPLLPQVAVEYLFDTFFSSGTVVSAQVTIYTRRHDYGDFARYNAWAELTADHQYRGVDEFGTDIIENVHLSFSRLVAL